MKVGSLFAGIGGFDLGFLRAGFEVAWCVEFDKNAQAVLRARFPDAKIYGDIREVDETKLERVDVICGGFPCQDVSVAGKRAGLAGQRTGLFYDAMRIVRAVNPSVLVLENVPGLLSSNHGLDFGVVLREVGEGWSCEEVAWRVLDSQYYGVAQRRNRVFVVASTAIGHAEQILALNESVCGDPPTRRAQGQDMAAGSQGSSPARRRVYGGSSQFVSDTVTSKWHKGSGGPAGSECGLFVAEMPMYQEIVSALCAEDHKMISNQYVNQAKVIVAPFAVCTANTNANGHGIAEDVTHTLDGAQGQAVAHAFYSTGGSHGLDSHPELLPPLKVGSAIDIPSPVAVAYRKSRRAQSSTDCETWVDDGIANTLNAFDVGDTRTTHAVCAIQGTLIGRVEGGPGGTGATVNGPMYTLTTTDVHAVAIPILPQATDADGWRAHRSQPDGRGNALGVGENGDPCPTLDCNQTPIVAVGNIQVDVIPLDLRNATRDAEKLDAQNRQGCGIGNAGDPSPTLLGHHTPRVCISIDEECNPADNLSGPLVRGGDGGRHAAVLVAPRAVTITFNDVNGTRADRPNGGMYVKFTDITGAITQAESDTKVLVAPTLTASNDPSRSPQSTEVTQQVAAVVAATGGMIVRRLTPVECERLQGFPDGWTDIGTSAKPSSDGNRYKQLGNAVTVNVAEWIARRVRAAAEQA